MGLAAKGAAAELRSSGRRPGRATRFGRWSLIALAGVVLLLVAVRAALPTIVLRYVNRTLDRIPGYAGRVADVDIGLWRGAYAIDGVDLVKTDGDVPVPFFSADRVDLSVEWREIFRGALVGEMHFRRPKINFVAGPTAETSQTGIHPSWKDRVRELFPLRINRFEIENGEAHYRDFHSDPKVDVVIDRVHAAATNLTNSREVSKTLVAKIDAEGRPYGESQLRLHVDLDPFREKATFNLAAELEDVDLRRLNDYTRAYGRFDVEKGRLALYTELAAVDGRFTGYLKPLIEGLDIVEWNEEEGNLLQRVWETLVGVTAAVFRNQPKDRWGTRIEFSGSLDDPRYSVWEIVLQVLRNTFVKALPKRLEGSVTLDDAERETGVDVRENASEEDESETAASKIDPRVPKRDADEDAETDDEPAGGEGERRRTGVLGE